MIAARLILAQLAPVPADPKPIATTIAAIRANPKRFDGRIVRLHGYVNSCQRLGCAIEERPPTAPGGPGDPKFDATITPLLPTYVEFDARVDAKCLVPATDKTITICSDRAPMLTVVSLRAIVSPEPPPFEGH